MTVQMTVRIPDELAEFVDQEVANGAKSRADVIAHALRRELRRRQAQRDAEIYASMAADPDEKQWAEWAAGNASAAWNELD
jgi:Arc/MetJ-type ribon-helix-helix transcriptional regulator